MEVQLLGKQERWQEDLFVAGPLSSLIPDDHILKQVDKVLDLSWLRRDVSEMYCHTNGRPGIDPEAAVRLMLAGFFQGIVYDRKLMREAQVNLAIRWFAGYRLDEKLPDHSSLTRIRQRWGAERFKQIFLKTIQSCMDAGLVNCDTVHVDATLIRADVSWASLTTEYADTVLKENACDEDTPKGPGRPSKKTPTPKKRSTTDPDATLTTSSHTYRMEPFYKQHGAVDDLCGVIVDVDVTTGQDNEGRQLPDQIERIEENTGLEINTLSTDAGYAHGKNYAYLEKKNIDAIIPPQKENNNPQCLPIRRFKYDAKNKIVKCPGGKILTRRTAHKQGWVYRSKAKDCRHCKLRQQCLSENVQSRSVMISHGYESLLRARRRHRDPDTKFRQLYARHRHQIEGMHGEAKTQHGLRRAVRRGLANVAIQAYLTAAVINLKRLVTYTQGLFDDFFGYWMDILTIVSNRITVKAIFAHRTEKRI
jgi:transposase